MYVILELKAISENHRILLSYPTQSGQTISLSLENKFFPLQDSGRLRRTLDECSVGVGTGQEPLGSEVFPRDF